MAKLSAHGTELARRETPTARIAVMTDGNILKNYGYGWKLWRRVKQGVDPAEYARKFNERTAAIMPEVRTYIDALVDTCDLEHRGRLHTAISLMPTDPDGVWSEMDDWSGYSIDLDDIVRCCRLYQVCEEAIKAAEPTPA
jgi:hypothetical protein